MQTLFIGARHTVRAWRAIPVVLSLVFMSALVEAKEHYTPKKWAATWTTAVKAPTPGFDFSLVPGAPNEFANVFPQIGDTTFRQIVRISAGGKVFRVWFTNEYGTAPLTINAARVAKRTEGSMVASAGKALTFAGEPSVTIPVGARVVSDPVHMHAASRTDLAISTYVAAFDADSPLTIHMRALQTNYEISGVGDQTAAAELAGATSRTQWYFLSAVDVLARKNLPVIVALGDSVTDGDQTTPEPVDLNERYTDFLAELFLKGKKRRARAAVVNAGISGGQVTDTLIGENALARLDRDVLSRSGATHMIFLEGINDIGLPGGLAILDLIGLFAPDGLEATFGRTFPPIEVAQIIAIQTQIAQQAKSAGLVTIGATLPPAGGFALPDYNTPAGEAKRQALNDWIRNSGTFDKVVDFDAVLRDPADPTLMFAPLSADGLHPNRDGYQAMAEAVLAVLTGTEED